LSNSYPLKPIGNLNVAPLSTLKKPSLFLNFVYIYMYIYMCVFCKIFTTISDDFPIHINLLIFLIDLEVDYFEAWTEVILVNNVV
jgi:hypothetical protein